MNILKETDIAAPPDRVYEYLLDFSRHHEWTDPAHAVQITPESAGPTGVGSVFISDARMFGKQHDRLQVTELVPNQRVVYEVTMKNGNLFRNTFEMRPSGDGTHLSKRFETVKLRLPEKLLSVFVGVFIAPKAIAGDVQRIKAHMEQPAPV